MENLMAWGSVSPEISGFLSILVASGYNIFISGGTGSGKTTFLNALSQYIPKDERIITIEDNAELKIRGIPNLVSLEARNANVEGTGAVTIRDLIKAALRMRPNRIIVGEVRSAEAIDMLQALNTGHDGSLSTGHANSPRDMLSRLETMVLMGMDLPLPAIRRQIASGLDLIVHLGRLRDKSRKVLEVTEVLGYQDGEIQLQTLYRFEEEGMKDGRLQGSWTKCHELSCRDKLLAAGYHEAGVAVDRGEGKRCHPLDSMAVLPDDLGDSGAAPFWVWHFRMMAGETCRKKESAFARQFKEAILTVSSALNTGYSVENAFRETKKELLLIYPEDARISKELQIVVRQLRLQVPVEQALEEFAGRVDLEDLRSFTAVFIAAKRSGGDMLAIIKDTAAQIGDKIDVKREIETILAAKQYEFRVMSAVPYVIIGI